MELPEASLATVEVWLKESLMFSGQSNDALLSLISKAFETISVALSQDSDNDSSMETIASLDNERKLALQLENEDFDVLRHFTFGLIESLQIALFQLRGRKNVMQCQRSTFDILLAKEPKEEPIDVSQVFSDDNQLFSHDFKEAEEVACKEEETDDLEYEFGFTNDAGDDTYPDQMNFEDMEGAVVAEDSSKNAMKKRNRSLRNVSRVMKYKNLADSSDNDSSTLVKKARSGSVEVTISALSDLSESDEKEHRVTKKSETEIECPECEFRTRSVHSWLDHLEKKHCTNATLAGVALRCECGVECFSSWHIYQCDIANFTVIRKRDGPIRRLYDDKITPKCILCEAYPKTTRGYARHLGKHHKSTLSANGIYLICTCGLIVRNDHCRHSKDSTCDGREFSLHKLDKAVVTGSNLILPRQTGTFGEEEIKEELNEEL